MAETIYLDRDYSTNGTLIPAGKVSTDDLKANFKLDDDGAKAMVQDLLRRQAKYSEYSKGITERHEHMHDSGTMAVGNNEG